MPPKYKKRPDGRYSTHVTVGIKPDGKPLRKTIYAKTIRELEDKSAELRHQVSTGTVVTDENTTVSEWASQWLKTYKTGVGRGTYEMYEKAVRVHIIPSIGHMRLKDVKPFHLQSIINSMRDRGITRVTEQTALTLKQIFKRAVENNLIVKNSAELIEIPKRQKPKKRALTDEEKKCFESADLDIKSKAFLFTLLYAGLRRGEALGLMWDDIDFEGNAISVSKTWVTHKNKPEIKPVPKSESGNRNIPMPSKLREILKELASDAKQPYVFASENDELMSLSFFRAFWDKIRKQLNTSMGGDSKNQKIPKDITPHIFRHSYATMLFYAGVDVKTAQYLLGHSSITVTMEIYTHLDKSKIFAVADKLDGLIASSQ